MRINGTTINQTTIIDGETYGSVRDYANAVDGSIKDNYNGSIFSLKNTYKISIDDTSFVVNGNIKKNTICTSKVQNGKGSIRYTVVDDTQNPGCVKILINMQDGVDLAISKDKSVSLSYDLGERGGTYNSNNYWDDYSFCAIPSNSFKSTYDDNYLRALVENLGDDFSFSTVIASLLSSKIQSYYIEQNLAKNTPFICINTYTNNFTNSSDAQIIAIPGSQLEVIGQNVGVFRYGVYNV